LNVQKPIEANRDVPKHAIVRENWEEISSFHRELFDKVARKLFILMAIILELPENYLLDAHAYEKEGDDHLRYMIYNVRTQEEWDKAQGYSKGGHTDFGLNPFSPSKN
jgi:isopenicillin N synthase-like dioxygenase